MFFYGTHYKSNWMTNNILENKYSETFEIKLFTKIRCISSFWEGISSGSLSFDFSLKPLLIFIPAL